MTTTPAALAACWSCKAAVVVAGDVACSSCGVVQPPGQASAFQRLGVDASLDVDDKALERAWLDRSRRVHPDRFAKKSDAERRYAAEQTASLNDAYRAIRDPFDRAVVLVRAAGVDVDKAAKLDQALLVALMEARERAESSPSEAAAVVDESKRRFGELAATIGALLKAASFEKAARALAEMKTLARLVDDLGGGKLISTLGER